MRTDHVRNRGAGQIKAAVDAVRDDKNGGQLNGSANISGDHKTTVFIKLLIAVMEAFQLALEAAQLIIKLLTVKPGQQLFSKAQNSIGKKENSSSIRITNAWERKPNTAKVHITPLKASSKKSCFKSRAAAL